MIKIIESKYKFTNHYLNLPVKIFVIAVSLAVLSGLSKVGALLLSLLLLGTVGGLAVVVLAVVVVLDVVLVNVVVGYEVLLLMPFL